MITLPHPVVKIKFFFLEAVGGRRIFEQIIAPACSLQSGFHRQIKKQR
ncbi:MAG: hypothetical protein MZV70_72615 [Desulfobacterales bacterium]|nr:hypothetical protein [Desulfobacterales bacterium]